MPAPLANPACVRPSTSYTAAEAIIPNATEGDENLLVVLGSGRRVVDQRMWTPCVVEVEVTADRSAGLADAVVGPADTAALARERKRRAEAARPVQAAFTSTASFSVGAAMPLLMVLVSPPRMLVPIVSIASLSFLALLGADRGEGRRCVAREGL
jgi:hypothetical protein